MNKKYMSNIRKAPNGWVLHAHFNAGTTITYLVRDLHGFDYPIWYNLYGMGNILSLDLVFKHFRVAYNSEIYYPNFSIVNIPLHKTFLISKGWLYYHDMQHLLKNNYFHIIINTSPP